MEGKGEAGPTGSVSEGEGRQRRVKRIEVRSRLLEAAERCFAESGYEGTSLERIALAAGFSKGAVYSNFASKEELFFDLMADRIEERAASIVAAWPSAEAASHEGLSSLAEDAGKKLRELVAADPAWQTLFIEFWLRCVRNEELRVRFAERRKAMREDLGQIVAAEAKKAGCGLALRPDEAATALLALSNGLGIEGLIDPELDLEPLMGRMLVLLFEAD